VCKGCGGSEAFKILENPTENLVVVEAIYFTTALFAAIFRDTVVQKNNAGNGAFQTIF